MLKFQCSYHQERLWFIDKFEKGTLYSEGPTYHNIPLIIELRETLEETILIEALSNTVESHEILRTKIDLHNGAPVQKVYEHAEIPVVRSSIAAIKGKEELFNFCINRVNIPFNLDSDFLLRVELHDKQDGSQLLLLVGHHLILDRPSLSILLDELALRYKAIKDGTTPILPAQALEYIDFTEWQRSLTAEALEPLLFYWKTKLRDFRPLDFFTDRDRDDIHLYEYGYLSIEWGDELAKKIDAQSYSPQALFIAVFKILMQKYSNQNDIIVGHFSNNRDQKETEQLVGPLANLVVLRDHINPSTSFNELIDLINKNINKSLEYKDISFDKLVSAIKPAKDMSRTALFDVLIHFEDRTAQNKTNYFLNSTDAILETNAGLGKYDYNFLIVKKEAGYEVNLTYNTLYYDKGTAERLLNHLSCLMGNLFSSPEIPVKEITYIGEAEKENLLKTLDNTNVSWNRDHTILDEFKTSVANFPNERAIIYKDKVLSYQELNKRSNELARYLIAQGVKKQDYVALLLPRSEMQIIGILAILKAAGIYVPIDTAYPEERISYIIKDCGAKVVVDEKLLTNYLDTKASYSSEELNPACKVTDIAYVIYTSGSSGAPKGVQVTHGNVIRLFKTDTPIFDFSEKDIWAQFHSYCFDFSVWEMYGALFFGGTVVVIPTDIAYDSQGFLDLLREQKVTILNQTPSSFYNLSAIKPWELEIALDLRYIIFGGEKLHLGKLKSWHEHYPQIALINMYGITETTVHVTHKKITKHDIDNNISNIGTPIPSLSCFVLDSELKPVPPLIPGELVVGGAGVTQGYINLPETTERVFIENPFGKGKLYRSGDKARLLSNGQLEYLGRIDSQIKIRGFRIEPNEIVNALSSFSSVVKALVIASENKNAEKEIVAYVVGEHLDFSKIRQGLKIKLPAYMIPAHFVELEAIPLTVNGKVDVKKLPLPNSAANLQGAVYIAPVNSQQEELQEIWGEVLALEKERISIEADFFELGGDSLKASRIVNKINTKIDVQLSVKDFFVNPSILKLSELIEIEEGEEEAIGEKDLIANSSKKNGINTAFIQPAAPKERYIVSTIQKRYWLDYINTHDGKFGNLFFKKEVIGDFNFTAYEQAIKTFVAHHEIFRTIYEVEGQEVFQRVLPKGTIKVALIDLREDDNVTATIARLENEAAHYVFNMSESPFFTTSVVRVSDAESIVFITTHHMVLDGIGFNLSLKEIWKYYQLEVEGNLAQVSPPAFQYKDFCEHNVAQYRHAESLLKQKQFWKKQLNNIVNNEYLPIDYSKQSSDDYTCGVYQFFVGQSLENELVAFSKKHKITPFMFFLAMQFLTFSYVARNRDMIIGAFVSGRNHVAFEEAIGFYSNLIMVRVKMKNIPFVQLLEEIKEAYLLANQHQDYHTYDIINDIGYKRKQWALPITTLNVIHMKYDKEIDVKTEGVFLDNIWNIRADLAFNILEYANASKLEFRFRKVLFENQLIHKISKVYLGFVKAVLQSPTTNIDELNIDN